MSRMLSVFNGIFLLFIIIMFILLLINSVQKKINLMGRAPINRIIFLLGKTANFSCWILFIFNYIKSFFIPYSPPFYFSIVSAISLISSTVLIALSFYFMGNLNRFGLPEDKTTLIDTGIYSISRNPMYLGFYLFNLSSILYYPHPVNIFLGILGITIHHLIVLGEERYLLYTLGENWIEYQNRVRRYF